jgi:hypothetical protein
LLVFEITVSYFGVMKAVWFWSSKIRKTRDDDKKVIRDFFFKKKDGPCHQLTTKIEALHRSNRRQQCNGMHAFLRRG